MIEKTDRNQVMAGLTAPDLMISLESFYGIKIVRIEHEASKGVLRGFMGENEEMAVRFDRVLFMNLAGRVRKIGGNVGFIQKVEVPSRWQGQGIGSSLVTEAVEVMERSGILEIYLDACPADSGRFEELIGFYERHGFVAAPDCGEDQYPPPFIMKADLRRLNHD